MQDTPWRLLRNIIVAQDALSTELAVSNVMRTDQGQNLKLVKEGNDTSASPVSKVWIDLVSILLHQALYLSLGSLLNEHLPDVTLHEGQRLHPSAIDVILRTPVARTFCHVINRDHVAMRNQHVHGEIQNLREQVEVIRDSLM